MNAANQPHLVVNGLHKLLHGFFGIARFAPSVGKELDGVDIGIGIGNAPRHKRARVSLRLPDFGQAGNEVNQGAHIKRQPDKKRQQHQRMKTAHNTQQGSKVNHHKHQHIAQDDAHIAHGQRRLHDFGCNAARKLVLVKRHALLEHQVVIHPAQAHGHIARQHLVLEQSVQPCKQRQACQQQRQRQQLAAFALPQLRGGNGSEPIDDIAQKAKQHGFKRSNSGSNQHQCCQMPAHAVQRETHKAPE